MIREVSHVCDPSDYSYNFFLTFYCDILNGESQNDGPDHTQCHLRIAINNF